MLPIIWNAFPFAIIFCVSCSHSQISTPANLVHPPTMQTEGENETNQREAPYVVLVSIDGYRWDFNELFRPAELSRIASEGASAESLLPIYPSKTFPNHYALATGLYANHHGIVSNEFYDPVRKAVFSLPDRAAVRDGSWYNGEPLWVSIRKQGLLTASMFWVGSEAKIAGLYPNYYFHYDASVSDLTRAEQVVKWLELPEARRPHFITLYFDAVDTAAHRYGVGSPEIKAAVGRVDAALTSLRAGIAKTGLPVNVIVVSDHGLANIDQAREVELDATPAMAELLKKFKVEGKGPQMLLYLNPGEDPKTLDQVRATMKREIQGAHPLSKAEMQHLHYDGNSRTGDLVIAPDANVLVGLKGQTHKKRGANHGWDPALTKEMHGILFADGPAFGSHVRVASFENVNVYPLVMKVLGVPVKATIDGRLKPASGLLKPTSRPAERSASDANF